MADLKLSLTDEDLKRLKRKASEERRTPENMAAYLVAKALEPKKMVRRKSTRKPRAT